MSREKANMTNNLAWFNFKCNYRITLQLAGPWTSFNRQTKKSIQTM